MKKLFLASAAMAVVVAAPVAQAASFTDVAPGEDTQDVARAVELGFMKGIGGSFMPYQEITRGQVVKALARSVAQQDNESVTSYVATNNLKETVAPFADVPATHRDQELYEASLIVKDSEIFSGANNQLATAKPITREQMAKVIYQTFNLEAHAQGYEVKDLHLAEAEYHEAIHILADNGITRPGLDGQFNPKDTVKRIQMAKFLVRAYDMEK